ncbi:MAG: hypothetical protein ACKOQ6_01885 [Bacteroidota bacterium]
MSKQTMRHVQPDTGQHLLFDYEMRRWMRTVPFDIRETVIAGVDLITRQIDMDGRLDSQKQGRRSAV